MTGVLELMLSFLLFVFILALSIFAFPILIVISILLEIYEKVRKKDE